MTSNEAQPVSPKPLTGEARIGMLFRGSRRAGSRGRLGPGYTMQTRRIVASLLIVTIVLGYGGAPALAGYARLLSPQSSAVVSGTVEVSAGFEASAKTPVTRVVLSVDGTEYGLKGLDAPQASGVVSILWDTTAFEDGPHGLSLYFYSGSKLAGKCYQKVQVQNHGEAAVTPPAKGSSVIQFSNLRDGERVSGRRQVAVNPSANLGQGVFLSVYVDKTLKLVSNRPPFEFSLDTAGLSDGPHAVEAQVRDASQNLLATYAIRITVENAGTIASAVREASSTAAAGPASTKSIERPQETRAIPASASASQPDNGSAVAARASEPATAAAIQPSAVTSEPRQDSSASRPAPAVQIPEQQPAAAPSVKTAPSDEPVAVAKAPASELPDPSSGQAATRMASLPAPHSVQMEVSVTPSVEAVSAEAPSVPAAAEATAPEASAPADTGEAVETASSLPPDETAASEPEFAGAEADARAVDSDITARPRTPAGAPEPATPAAPAASPVAAAPAVKPETKWQGQMARAVEDPRLSRPPLITTPAVKPNSAATVDQVRPLPPKTLVEPNAGTPHAAVAGKVLMASLPPASPAPAGDGLMARPAPAVEEEVPEPAAPPASSAAGIQPEAKAETAWPGASPKAEAADVVARPAAPVRVALAPASAGARTAAVSETSTGETVTYTEQALSGVRGPAMITLRMAMEHLGGSVSWDHFGKTATVWLGGHKLMVDVRAGTAAVDGRQIGDARVTLTAGRIHLSAIEVARAMGLRLTADPRTHQVRLSRLAGNAQAD